MIREILTLFVDNAPVQYYISFDRDRKRFNFQPTLQNKNAPYFEILIEGKTLITSIKMEASLEQQAKEKVNEILNNEIFDQFK